MRLILAAVISFTGMSSLWAAEKPPVVVELFTSKYCPSCPAAEARLKSFANENPDALVLFEHVDYWDRGPNQKDPHGLAEVTQRQYDYSNTLGERPGQVYTPMPLLEGQIMVGAPLMFTWGSAYDKANALPAKALLTLSKTKDGALDIPLPANLRDKTHEVWVFGLEPVDDTKAWRVTGLVKAQMRDDKAHVTGPMVPKGEHVLVLLQKNGPGAVLASGWL